MEKISKAKTLRLEISQTSTLPERRSKQSKKRRTPSEWRELAEERGKEVRHLQNLVETLKNRLLLATTVNRAKNKYLIECNLLDDFWQWSGKEDSLYNEEVSESVL